MRIRFEDEQQKADWVASRALHDARIPAVGRLARQLVYQTRATVEQLPASSRPSLESAYCDAAHVWVRDSIRYVRDWTAGAGYGEQLAPPDVVLARGWDDCDGKARLVAGLVNAAQIECSLSCEARILPVWQGGHFVHVQALVRYPGSDAHPKALDAGWLVSDPIVCGARLGDQPGEYRLPDGRIPTC